MVAHSLHAVLSLLYSTAAIHHAEITPPLSFLASWLSTRLGDSPELLRLPSLIGGHAHDPASCTSWARGPWGAGLRWSATALTALSPFMIYYSTEARAYALMMLLLAGSTLSLLLALDTGRRPWWVLYAVCSCAALYTHYTCAFVLAAQFLWLVWAHPEARRVRAPGQPRRTRRAGAVDPRTDQRPLLAHSQDPLRAVPVHGARHPADLAHWALGYPYAGSVSLTPVSLSELPGVAALVLLAVATFPAAAALGWRPGGGASPWRAARDRRTLLILALALATPVGEAVVSLAQHPHLRRPQPRRLVAVAGAVVRAAAERQPAGAADRVPAGGNRRIRARQRAAARSRPTSAPTTSRRRR